MKRFQLTDAYPGALLGAACAMAILVRGDGIVLTITGLGIIVGGALLGATFGLLFGAFLSAKGQSARQRTTTPARDDDDSQARYGARWNAIAMAQDVHTVATSISRVMGTDPNDVPDPVLARAVGEIERLIGMAGRLRDRVNDSGDLRAVAEIDARLALAQNVARRLRREEEVAVSEDDHGCC